MTKYYAIFFRRYCEMLGRDYWAVDSWYESEKEALDAIENRIRLTWIIQPVYCPKGEVPNL